MCEWAVKQMRTISPATGKGERLEMLPKEKVEEMLQTNGLQLENLVGYDHVYVANM